MRFASLPCPLHEFLSSIPLIEVGSSGVVLLIQEV
jgi:hypothetical protein